MTLTTRPIQRQGQKLAEAILPLPLFACMAVVGQLYVYRLLAFSSKALNVGLPDKASKLRLNKDQVVTVILFKLVCSPYSGKKCMQSWLQRKRKHFLHFYLYNLVGICNWCSKDNDDCNW
jgi:hypothetical protein